MTYEETMKLAEEVFNEEYSGLDKDSFLIGFREAYNALTALYRDNFELVKQMRKAQEDCIFKSVFSTMGNTNTAAYSSAVTKRKTLEFKVDDMIKEMEDLK